MYAHICVYFILDDFIIELNKKINKQINKQKDKQKDK